MKDEETRPVKRLHSQLVETGIEIWLRSDGELEQRIPITQLETEIGRPAKFYVLWSSTETKVVSANGSPLRLGQESSNEFIVQSGDQLEFEDLRILIVDLSKPALASLECYSEPYYLRCWELSEGLVTVGRQGRRHNQIELNHETVSRAHADLEVSPNGCRVTTLSETGLTQVNESAMAVNASHSLQDGDLVFFGELTFRFRWKAEPAQPGVLPLLNAVSLGTFDLRIGESPVDEQLWRSQKSKMLLARLCLEWGRAVNVDLLVDLLWDDMDPDRGRKNLNWTLNQTRKMLGSESPVDYFVRTPQSLQLNPQVLGRHDLVELLQIHREVSQIDSQTPLSRLEDWLNRLTAVYAGPYLDGLDDTWILGRREHFHEKTLQCALLLQRAFVQRSAHQQIVKTGLFLVDLDPMCQEAYQHSMQSHLELGAPGEAIRLFEACKKRLKRDLEIEPSIELMRIFQMAKLQS